MAELEQYSRINDVELKGVPQTKGEDCCDIVKVIGQKIGCSVDSNDIVVVHYVRAKQGQNIIVRFCSLTKKADFAAKAKKARLTTSLIGFRAQWAARNDQPAFVNDHLIPANKRLFHKVGHSRRESSGNFYG